jgi:hypothetical protein
MTPAQCVEQFESALQRHGRSLSTLTAGECNRLQYNISGTSDFPDLLEKLQTRAPAPFENSNSPRATLNTPRVA